MIIAIVIPSFNRKLILKNLLSQIDSQSKKISIKIVVIAVIDGSNDGTIEMLDSEFQLVDKVIGDGNWWFTRSLNEGIKLALSKNASYVLTMNDDVILEDDFFEKLQRKIPSFKKNEIVGVVSYSLDNKNKITSPGVKEIKWWRAKLVTYYHHLEDVGNSPPNGVVESKVLPTRGLLIPTDILKSLNFFDEKFPQYFSDYDFCLRAAKKGANVLLDYDICLYTMDTLTTKTVSFQSSLSSHLRSIFNKYSRLYLPHVFRYYWRHGNRPAFPFTVSLIYFVSFIKIFKNKFQTP